MSKNGHTIPEHLRPKPGTLFINSTECRRSYSRAAALLNMWQKAAEERGDNGKLSNKR